MKLAGSSKVELEQRMYTGTLIHDLLITVDKVLKSAAKQRANRPLGTDYPGEYGTSESEQFPQSFGLCSADGDFGLLLVVHPELIRALEPGDDFADAVDIHEVGAVRAPK